MKLYPALSVRGAYQDMVEPIRCLLGAVAVAAFLIAVPHEGNAADWVPISGQIQFDGTPLCALVLANGQHMFSCDGNGEYHLTVPLNNNGTITLFVFASGFAPFKQVLTSGEAASYTVAMIRSDTARVLDIDRTLASSSRGDWVNISGTVQYDGAPVCAMVLANGQHMFTCGDSLGRFSMDVPLNSDSEIMLYGFVAGFAPSKEIMNGAGYAGGGCIGDVYGCITISGDSKVPSAFTPNTESIGGGAAANYGWVTADWINTDPFNFWSLGASIADNYQGISGSEIYFRSPVGPLYECQSGFVGSLGNCSGASADHATRTFTFSNVELVGPGGVVITVNGALKY